jgi:uncharacterized protein
MYELSFDLIIAIVMAGVPLLLWYRRDKPSAWHGILAVLWVVVGYGSFIEPQLLVTREYAARLPVRQAGIGDGDRTLRVAVISDLHLGVYKHEAWVARVVRAVNATEPDLVLIAGDTVSRMAGTKQFGPLRDLAPRYGVFAALGNWDYRVGAVDVRHAIESTGVEVLTNESVAFEVDGHRVRLIGLDDLWYGDPDWDAALAERREGETTILLVHDPDAALGAEANGIDLTVAGHTHGGQIRLPFLGPVTPLPTDLGRRYDKGVFPIGPSTLFLTPGVGESGPRARFFAPPEISLLTLTF